LPSLDGKDHYLGKYESAESREKYHRLVAEWFAIVHAGRPGTAASEPVGGLTVNELILAYVRFVDGYYVKDGRATIEPGNIRLVLRIVRRLYGTTHATSFGPLALKAVRDEMVRAGNCRSEINRRVGRVVRMFKWGVSEELVPPNVYEALRAVAGLRKGRSQAREKPPVGPVAEADVEAVRSHVSRQVWAMIEIQRLTAMRPGEVVIMRP
jgi:integrase